MSCKWCAVGQCQVKHAPRARRGGSKKGHKRNMTPWLLRQAEKWSPTERRGPAPTGPR